MIKLKQQYKYILTQLTWHYNETCKNTQHTGLPLPSFLHLLHVTIENL